MTWSTLHDKARAMGFELECHSGADMAATGRGGAWLRVGGFDQGSGLWAQALTPQARELSPERVAAMISSCSEHISTLGDYDADFPASLAPIRAALDNPDHGRMPA